VALLQVLDVLWELAHLPTLPSSLIQQALEEHLTILSDAYAVKEAIKRSYIIKCIEDIKRPGEWSGLEKNKKDGFKAARWADWGLCLPARLHRN